MKEHPTGRRKRKLRISDSSDNRSSDGLHLSDEEINGEREPNLPPPSAGHYTAELSRFLKEIDAESIKLSGNSDEYSREVRLKALHKLLLREVPIDKIAQQLGVSRDTVERDRRVLYKQLKKEAQSLDINEMIGDTLAFYRDITSSALRLASDPSAPVAARLAAMKTALQSKNDSHKFMQAAGVYDVLKFRAEVESDKEDVSTLIRNTRILLEDDDEDFKKSGLDESYRDEVRPDEEDLSGVRLL